MKRPSRRVVYVAAAMLVGAAIAVGYVVLRDRGPLASLPHSNRDRSTDSTAPLAPRDWEPGPAVRADYAALDRAGLSRARAETLAALDRAIDDLAGRDDPDGRNRRARLEHARTQLARAIERDR